MTSVKQQVYDVIVMGAGAAGLAAAHRLMQRSLSRDRHWQILILEARDRIGGRIHSVPLSVVEHNNNNENNKSNKTVDGKKVFGGGVVDLGATWVHGDRKPNPLVALAEEQGIALIRDHWDLSVFDEKGKKLSENVVERTHDGVEKIVEKAQEYAEDLTKSVSLQDAILHTNRQALKDPTIRYAIQLDVEFDYGDSLAYIDSATFDEDSSFPGKDAVPSKGMTAILKGLVQDLKDCPEVVTLKLSQPIESVDYSESNNAIITTSNGTKYQSKTVICTIPLGVLKSNDVTFSPPLSSQKTQAIQRIGFGAATKVVVHFDHVFWPPKMTGFAVASLEPKIAYIFNRFAFSKVPTLEAYILGDYARAIASGKDDDGNVVVRQVLEQISLMFRLTVEKVQSHVVETKLTHWTTEPYTKGSYSYSSIHTHKGDYHTFSQPERNMIFFAGEHTFLKYRGSVHGAYISGLKAAVAVVNQLDQGSQR